MRPRQGLWACYEHNIILTFNSKNLQKLYTCIMYHMKSIRANVKSTLIDSHSEDVSCLAPKYSTLSSMFEVAFPTVRIVLNCEVFFCKTFDPAPFADDRRLCDF